jgi:hypothetical protein
MRPRTAQTALVRAQPLRAKPLQLPAAWLVVVCGALTLTSVPTRASDARELSSEEEADLRAGKLVVRPIEKLLRGRQMIGGMAWQLIDANVETVYAAMTDVNAHVKYLPAAEEVRQVAPGPPPVLFVQHRLGLIRAGYFVRTIHDASQHSVRIVLDHSRPASIRDAWAELRVHPYGQQRSVVSLVVMADLGDSLVIRLIRSNVHSWMLRVPLLLKRYVEGSAKAAKAH